MTTYINVTALTFPAGAESEIEKRFAHRQHNVDQFPGFQSFELWRPVEGENRYFVLTRWDSKADFDNYVAKRDDHAHKEDQARGMSVELLGFELIEDTDKE